MALPVLDLTKPGVFWARAENEKDTTFHLVIPKDRYTKEALSENPTIDPGDMVMTPFTVAEGAVDPQGRAVFDLEKTGRVGDIVQKIEERVGRGETAPTRVRSVVVVSAKDSNRMPRKAIADVMDFELGAVPLIVPTVVRGIITVQNFKAGQKNFEIDIRVLGPIPSLKLSLDRGDLQILLATGGGGWGSVETPAGDGKIIKVLVPAWFQRRDEQMTIQVPRTYINFVPGGWRRGETDPRTDTREIWTGGDINLKIQGGGAFSAIQKTVRLRAESWASEWLQGPPPPPFSHNIC